MAVDYKPHEEEINLSYTDTMYAMYLEGLYGIAAGYIYEPLWQVRLDKTILDWQLGNACTGKLCARSMTSGQSYIGSYPTFGNSPFELACDPDPCYVPGRSFINATPQTIVLTTDPLSIDQYTVDGTGGPTSGTNVFTLTSLVGKVVDVALGVLLTLNSDYIFNSTTGTITLLKGRLFNSGEVYTIFSY